MCLLLNFNTLQEILELIIKLGKLSIHFWANDSQKCMFIFCGFDKQHDQKQHGRVWWFEWEWPSEAHKFEYLVTGECSHYLKGLEDVALLEEVCQWGGVWGFKRHRVSLSLFLLPLGLGVELSTMSLALWLTA